MRNALDIFYIMLMLKSLPVNQAERWQNQISEPTFQNQLLFGFRK